jgi:hypothetical protein
MRRKLLVLLALVAVLAVMVAAPVSAKEKPISGKMEISLNLFKCPGEGPFLSWTGTVVIDGKTYGWADEPLLVEDPPVLPNEKFVYFEEHWTIFTLEDGEDPNEDPSLACDVNDVVLEGFNTGWGPPGFTGKADGYVRDAADPGPFALVKDGSRMFWRGKVLGGEPVPGSQFKATLHIFPLK